MANVNGVNYTKELAGILPKDFLGAEWRGRVKCLVERYTAAALAIGQTIGVGKLKANQVFLDAKVVNAALGASSTLQMGDSGDDDRYMAAFSTVSAGCNRICAQAGAGYKPTTDTEIFLTVAGGAITGQIDVVIFYADIG